MCHNYDHVLFHDESAHLCHLVAVNYWTGVLFVVCYKWGSMSLLHIYQ